MQTTTRNATMDDLIAILREQHARKVDVVAPATAIRSINGTLVIQGAEHEMTMEGVTSTDGTYVPTAVCDEGLAEKLGVPVTYLKRLRTARPDLYDANVNGWLHGADRVLGPIIPVEGGSIGGFGERDVIRAGHDADARKFFVRGFRGEDGPGVARAFLSDRYAAIDHLDTLTATMAAIRQSGMHVEVERADLTDRRMYVRLTCPEVSAMAPTLLAGYRSPFTGATGDENPTVWAGLILTNSEVGSGAYTLTPGITVEVCRNGMTITKDAMTRAHLGARMDEGVRYAADTHAAHLDLITKQTRDAVRTFLSPEYLTATVNTMERHAATEVTHEGVKDVTKALRYSDAQTDAILGYFTRGGQTTMAGLVNAVTAYAQDTDLDGDTAADMEASATALLLR